MREQHVEVLSVEAAIGREFDLVVVADVSSLAFSDAIERLEPALDAGLIGVSESCGAYGVTDMGGRRLLDTARLP